MFDDLSALSRFSELIGTVYEGPLDDPPWRRQLSVLAGAMEANGAYLILRRPSDTGMGVIVSADSALQAQPHVPYYAQRLHTLDPFVNLPPNRPVVLSELIDEGELLDSEFFRLTMVPLDMFHALGVDLRDETGPGADLRFLRGQGQPPFGEAEKQLCAVLVPHLCRALRSYTRNSEIETEREVYAGAMSQLAVATILLDKDRQVLRTNPLADRLLAGESACRLVDGRLQLRDPTDNARLRQLIAEVAEAQQSGTATLARAMLISRETDALQLSLVVRAAPPGAFPEGASVPAVAVFVSDPNHQPEASTTLLGELFGLTPTESRLALVLVNGATIDSAALQLSISPHTVRAHLRSIFAKTGVSRQPELVRLILTSVASLG